MAGKYIGYEPIKTQDGRILKHGDILEEMPDAEAEARYGFEPVTKTKKESKKTIYYKESDDE